MRRTFFAFALAALVTTAHAGPTSAAFWCAGPLWVHEWGVHVFRGDGASVTAGLIPDFFHRRHGNAGAGGAVRDLPADGGERDLPVLHFYGVGPQTIPVGIEVGFAEGAATAWFPAVDAWRNADMANSLEARSEREALVASRTQGATPEGRYAPRDPPPSDPTRQLIWDRLELTPTPAAPPVATPMAWVNSARAFDKALWVNGASESERFVFYEGKTAERVPLKVRRLIQFSLNPRIYQLTNESAAPVHDVFVTQRAKGQTLTAYIPTVGAGASVRFTLDKEDARGLDAKTRGRLRATLTEPAAPKDTRSGVPGQDCVTDRDPAVPYERAVSHRLFAEEVDLIMSVWAARFFDAPGTTIVYREDEATLHAAMPLSIHTDMAHFIVLHRAGLALWEGVPLD